MIFVTRGMIFWVSIVTSVGLLALAVHYWAQVREECAVFSRRWFTSWVLRGVVVPMVVWIYLNLGQPPLMPPLVKQIEVMRSFGLWGGALAAQACLGLMVLAILWSAITFAWFVAGILSVARNDDDILMVGILWSPAVLPVCVGLFFTFGWAGVVLGAALGLGAFTHYALTVIDTRLPEPCYGGAIGKLKMGKYAEAEMSIVTELEKCETHFEGWLLLAEIYALHFHDLTEAERTIHELCEQPETGLSEISIALHRLADWQLKLRNDAEAAQRTLQDICTRMPGTHLDMMARHRINQLAGGNPDYDEQHQPRVVAMPKTMLPLNAAPEHLATAAERELAQRAADVCIEKLQQDPKDHAAREKLARIFAEELRQVDLALEQIELLLEMPEQPPGKTEEWLSLLAHWLIRYRDDREQGMKLLRRIIEEFPRSPQAFEAQRRVSLMEMEERARRRRPLSSGSAEATEAGAAAT